MSLMTALLEAALNAATTIQSDYEASSFLQEVLKQNSVEGTVRAPFFKALAAVNSNYERGRVLQAVIRKPDAGKDTLRDALRATAGMSGYELSQVLQLLARTHTISAELRDAYLDAADRLSGYEQNQVLSALVRSERGRK
jgi:hypothetical protein